MMRMRAPLIGSALVIAVMGSLLPTDDKARRLAQRVRRGTERLERGDGVCLQRDEARTRDLYTVGSVQRCLRPVLTDCLADNAGVALEIEQVVGHLECQSEVFAVERQRAALVGRCVG